MVRGGDGGATHRRHPPRWIGLRIVERRQAWAAGHTRSGKEGCIDPLGEDHFDLDAIGIEEVDLGVSGIGNRGSLEVHRMGATEIGRESCRERGRQYVKILVVAVSLKKK